MTLRTPLGQVRGLGAAKNGTHHWWLQRVTAIANIPLLLWLVASLVMGVASDHLVFSAWVAQPLTAILLILLGINLFLHIALGLQVLVEDYVHDGAMKIAALLAVKFFAIAGGVATAFSVLKIAFGA